MHHRLDNFLRAVTDGAARLQALREAFVTSYGTEPTVAVSAPGRTEIIGNHTDHNGGKVVAAAVDLDALIVASPAGGSRSSFGPSDGRRSSRWITPPIPPSIRTTPRN